MYTLERSDVMKQRNCLKDVDSKGVSFSFSEKERAVNLDIENLGAVHCQKLGAVVSQLVHTTKE